MKTSTLIKRTVRIEKTDDKILKGHSKHHGSESAVIRFALRHLEVCDEVNCELPGGKFYKKIKKPLKP